MEHDEVGAQVTYDALDIVLIVIARKQLLLAERIARDDQPPPFWGAPKSAQSPASSHSTETQTVGAAAVSIPVTVHSDSGMSASPLTQLMPTL